MAVFKCASCGANLELVKGTKIFTCRYCGTEQKLPEETVPVRRTSKKVETLMKRGFMLLEDTEFKKADKCFDKVLDIEPENGTAYFGKLMAGVRTSVKTELAPILKRNALLEGGKKLLKRVMEFSPRLIREILSRDFYKAQSLMSEGKEAEAFKIFDYLSRYLPEATEIAEPIRERLRTQFSRACSLMKEKNYEKALYIFHDIAKYYGEYNDEVEAKIRECYKRLNLQMYRVQCKARSLMEEGKYEEAFSMFEAVERINIYYSNHHESGYIYLDDEMEEMYYEAPHDLDRCLAKLKGEGMNSENFSS